MEKFWTTPPGWILVRAVVLGLRAFVAWADGQRGMRAGEHRAHHQVSGPER